VLLEKGFCFIAAHLPFQTTERKDKGYWRDYLVDGKPVVNPLQQQALFEGYRLCHLRHVVTRGQGQHCNGHDQDGIPER